MLDFIERYQEYLKIGRKLPTSFQEINKLLNSEFYENIYKISKKDKIFVVTNDDPKAKVIYGDSINFDFLNLKECCKYIYEEIGSSYPRLLRVDFLAKKKLLNKFPKKYIKIILPLLELLFEIDPFFDKNCQIKLPSEVSDSYFKINNYSKRPYSKEKSFCYIVYAKSTMIETMFFLNNEGDYVDSPLKKHIQKNFNLVYINEWATGLILKDKIISRQQLWNNKNKEKIANSNIKYSSKKPIISFRPNEKAIEKLENIRLDHENDTDLLNRIINTYI